MSPETPLLARHRFTREQYYAMADQGHFGGCRVERIEGEIVDMRPQRSRHSVTISRTARALELAFGAEYYVRVQMPLRLGQDSDPEPDVAVVHGQMLDFLDAHPATAVLVVEVAETTLAYDLDVKARLYAQAGVADYWVIDIEGARLVVHRGPRPEAGPALRLVGHEPALAAYRQVTDHRIGDSVSPLAIPAVIVLASDLLPPRR